jgi:hypothetical protein
MKLQLNDDQVLEITSEFTGCYQGAFKFRLAINDGLILIETDSGTTVTIGYNHVSHNKAGFSECLDARKADDQDFFTDHTTDFIETYQE